jgi:DUF218 domain
LALGWFRLLAAVLVKILERLRLVRSREGWFPTFRGGVVALGLTGALGLIVLLRLHPFLAVTERVESDLLAVEGWVPDFVHEAGLGEFRRGGYRLLLVPGGPLEKGEPLSEYRTFAEFGAAVLARYGCPTNVLRAVPAPKVRHDRTYASAFALRQWLVREKLLPRRLNVVTADSHARRTRLLFQKAFGEETEIGIIAIPDDRFDPLRWWRSSQGFRTVTGEAIGYVYARFLFSPPEELSAPSAAIP